MKQSIDIAGIRRILGTVNYLAKLLPHLSQVSEPLWQLTRNGQPFTWDKTNDDAFSEIKKLISAPAVLKYYRCDAGDNGLSAAHIQEGKPVAFASRALAHAEKQCAQIKN